jgi:hypothetical protein
MRRFVILLAVASAALAADPPTGESLMQRFIDRSGGADAWANAKNIEMTGTVAIVGRNIRGSVIIVEQGEKSYTAMELPGVGKLEECFDGENAWQMSAIEGPRILDGDEKRSIETASSLGLMTSWRTIYKSAHTSGQEEINGHTAWKVDMTPNDGKPETYSFDGDSGLLLRISMVLSTPLGDIPTRVTMSDYQTVNGIQMPSTVTQEAVNQVISMHFDRIVFNATLPPDRFDPPPDVKALIEKRKR